MYSIASQPHTVLPFSLHHRCPPALKPAAASLPHHSSLSSLLDTASSCDALDSDDAVYAPVQLRQAAMLQHHQQQRPPQIHLQQLSLAAAKHVYPLIAAAYWATAGATAGAVQLFGAATTALAADLLLVTFAQLLGGAYILQGAVAVVSRASAARGQLHGTTCQRMLLASLLAMTGNIMSVGKAALATASILPTVWLAVLLATFCSHVACHLPHHPLFLVKVLWPVAATMVITDITHLLPAQHLLAVGSGGALGTGRLHALLAALLSVKAISKLSRLAAGAAPRVAQQILRSPIAACLARRSSRLLPVLARRLGGAAPKITRLGGRLATRMAPRCAKDKFVGNTMHIAFPDADEGMTQTVAKSIDLLPPKTTTGFVYTALLVLQLLMLASAYCPSLLFQLPAVSTAAATDVAGTAFAAAAGATVGTNVAAASLPQAAAQAAAAAAGIGDPLLRTIKYAWGSGFLIAAFACNCLKTAADRHHSWAPQNRQLAFALGAMQAVTAWVLLKGLCAGAVQASAYAWCHIALAAAGACFCLVQAATATSTTTQQLWAGSAASSSQAEGVDGSLFGPVAATTLVPATLGRV